MEEEPELEEGAELFEELTDAELIDEEAEEESEGDSEEQADE